MKKRVERDKVEIVGYLIPFLIGKGMGVEAYLTDAFWYSVGSTENYEKIDTEMTLLEYRKS